jgi:hypothetical protein
VARWTDQVDSVREFDHNGNPAKIAIGKAVLLESPANWIGNFELDDPETMDIFNRYVGRTKWRKWHKPSSTPSAMLGGNAGFSI